MPTSSTNPALELAFDYVAFTGRNVFLTGKAGTGKTTFLHRVKREVSKTMAVAAPTGVAAINAGAQTLHSLFSLPFGFLTPGRPVHTGKRRISRKKAAVLRSIDLLVIDEISMVRADVLDAVDTVLRAVRGNGKPFGGVQLLMIGDLHQLPPVVTRSEENEVRQHYTSPYYFSAKVMQRARPVSIPLTHIYRQRDGEFIDLLNKVRHNQIDRAVIEQLNSRYKEGQPTASDGTITLTSHNASANRINADRLNRTPGTAEVFTAVIEDKFPESMYPGDQQLRLKIGAQVMFNRNDNASGLYFNGKIGHVTAMSEEGVTVRCEGDEHPIEVLPVVWENKEHVPDTENGGVREVTVGTFTQLPLRLAWAITIHKSQGLTFDKLTIDAANSFSHGQVYVALSRCKTFGGITLTSRITEQSIRTDRLVAEHSAATERDCPGEEDLRQDRCSFQFTCLEELFDFSDLKQQAAQVARTLNDPGTRIQGDGVTRFMNLRRELAEELARIGTKFLPVIHGYRTTNLEPETDDTIKERLAKAARYFDGHLRGALGKELLGYEFLCDNTAVRNKLTTELYTLRQGYFIKQRCFEQLLEGFTAADYTHARATARREFDTNGFKSVATTLFGKEGQTQRTHSAEAGLEHPALYRKLAAWRLDRCRELDVPAFHILHNRVLVNICTDLPLTEEALLAISGFGKVSLERYGVDILAIIKHYTMKHRGLAAQQTTRGKLVKTLDLLRAGKTIAEIATEQRLAPDTIYSNAANWVRAGVLQPAQVLGAARLAEVTQFTAGHSLTDLGVLYKKGDGKYSVGELRIALTPIANKEIAA